GILDLRWTEKYCNTRLPLTLGIDVPLQPLIRYRQVSAPALSLQFPIPHRNLRRSNSMQLSRSLPNISLCTYDNIPMSSFDMMARSLIRPNSSLGQKIFHLIS